MKGKVWAGVDASETFTQAPSAKKCCTMRMTFPPQQLHEPSTLPSPRGFWGSHGRACAPVQASGGGLTTMRSGALFPAPLANATRLLAAGGLDTRAETSRSNPPPSPRLW